jgi:uncharacterized membrane-anchored protein YhcB (DUF1043 family)
MSKRYLRRAWKRLKPIHTWYFFAGFVIFLVIGVFAARQNNLRSIELRNEVLTVDEQNGDIEAALQKLREHMYSHMNAGLSNDSLKQPIQLKYRYERLLAQQQEKASKSNQKLYAQAQAYCEGQGGTLRGDRVPCVQQYVSERSSSAAVTIPDELYKFDFVSPRWSPDLAGISLLLSGVFLALFLIRFLTERWFKAELRANL